MTLIGSLRLGQVEMSAVHGGLVSFRSTFVFTHTTLTPGSTLRFRLCEEIAVSLMSAGSSWMTCGERPAGPA